MKQTILTADAFGTLLHECYRTSLLELVKYSHKVLLNVLCYLDSDQPLIIFPFKPCCCCLSLHRLIIYLLRQFQAFVFRFHVVLPSFGLHLYGFFSLYRLH